MEIITVPHVLREKLGDDGADSLVELLNRASDRRKEDVLIFVEEKFERRLSEEIGKVNERLTAEIGKMNERLTQEVARLEIQIQKSHTDTIRWMFIFWVGQIGVILGMLFAFFR